MKFQPPLKALLRVLRMTDLQLVIEQRQWPVAGTKCMQLHCRLHWHGHGMLFSRIIKHISHLCTGRSRSELWIRNIRASESSLFVCITCYVSMDVTGPHQQQQFLKQSNLSAPTSTATLCINRFLHSDTRIMEKIAKLRFNLSCYYWLKIPLMLGRLSKNKYKRKYHRGPGR